MARKVFYSFHYEADNWRAGQIRNIGKVEGNKIASDNDWETIKGGGDNAIKKWIDDQLQGTSCCIVLIGKDTANRKWIKYEIETARNQGKGVLGIYIHNLKDKFSNTSIKGKNPFEQFTLKNGGNLSSIVKCYDPKSYDAYNDIRNNIENWIEQAIQARK